MGRPKKKIDVDQLEWMAKRQCTHDEIAETLGCSVSTLRSRFQRRLARWRSIGKTRLRAMQWRRACKGSDSMLIFLGKQYLGQSEKVNAAIQTASMPVDTIAVYEANPEIMARALASEEELENARSNTLSNQLGATRHSGLGEPPAHSPPSGNGNGDARQHGDKPDHRGDAG
jgi:hypothetical protein